jgi:glycosyltransferase involved in cell wall biosynthesis
MHIPVFHSYGKWYLSGVGTWTVNLIKVMAGTKFNSTVLFTGIPHQNQPQLDNLGIPYLFLDVPSPRKRREEWRVLKAFLEDNAPCIYITNFDFHRSCAVGTLAPSVRVVIVIHSDEECYFDELHRIGQDCNVIICVSTYLTNKVKNRFPNLAKRVHYIPYGIPIPKELPIERPVNGPLRLCYCNRLQQYQKRVFDLPIIAQKLEELGVNYELDIAGDGEDEGELRCRFLNANLKCLVRFHGRITSNAVIELCSSCHLFLLTSEFEGLPISLLEAMSVGCVPVVYESESGISDAIPSAEYGRLIEHANTTQFSAAIKELGESRNTLEHIGGRAANHIYTHFSSKKMGNAYYNIFKEIIATGDSLVPKRTQCIHIPHDLSRLYRLRRKISSFIAKYSSNNH